MAQGPYLEVVDINYVNGELEGTITLYNAPEKDSFSLVGEAGISNMP